jgi:hypothetical protein
MSDELHKSEEEVAPVGPNAAAGCRACGECCRRDERDWEADS